MKVNIKKISIVIFCVVYGMLTIFFCFGKRTEESVEERRKTAKLPIFSFENLINDNWTKKFDDFFVDTVPLRDKLVEYYIRFKHYNGYQTKDNIKIINTNNKSGISQDLLIDNDENNNFENEIDTYLNNTNLKDDEKKLDAKDYKELVENDYDILPSREGSTLVVIGDGPTVRGVNAYLGDIHIGDRVADNINAFREAVDSSVNMYYMVVPQASAFYLPKQLKNLWRDQRECIDYAIKHLKNVEGINIFDNLFEHKDEDIYFRTDYHWTQRGGYYGAEVMAKQLGLKFEPLSSYEEKKVEKYCSSYFRYSEDLRFIQNPETLYYYDPKIPYETTQIRYNPDVTSPDYVLGIDYNTTFFKHFDAGNTWAYFTFMGGDPYGTIVKIKNDTGRKLMIIKDSFGNALAPNFFFSFDEVHVFDFRYYQGNINDYIRANGITDVLLESEITMMHEESRVYKNFLKENNHTTLY